MEQNSQPDNTITGIPETKKSKAPLIGMISLGVLAVAGVAFGVVSLINTSNKSAEISDLKAQIAQLTQNNTTQPTQESTPAARFKAYADNLAASIKSNTGSFDRELASGQSGTLMAEIDNQLNLVLRSGGKTYTIATNVIDCEFVYVGNGGGPSLYFIDKDGHVGATEQLFMDLSARAPQVTTDMVSSPNIVSISNYSAGAGLDVEYVDIDGNIKR